MQVRGLPGAHSVHMPSRAESKHPPEDVVDSSLGPLFRGRHQMRVDAQGEARVGVSQVLRQGPDRLPRVEQDACVEVPERVHAVFAGRFDPGQD